LNISDNFFAELLNYEETNPIWKSYHYDYTQSPFLDQTEIDSLRHELDPLEFASEYLASIEESGNNVFYTFDRKVHVDPDLPDIIKPVYEDGDCVEAGEDIHIAIDFNVGLQCSSVGAIRGNQVHWLDEFKGHPDTETLAIAIKGRYKDHKIFAYPDPSGRSRKTSAPVGVTDFTILEQAGIICLAHKKAPPIIDSVAAVNKKLKTAAGDVGMYIHPRCKGIIKSLERTRWVDNNADTATIDKTEGIEHYSDGIRYFTEFKFPVQRKHNRVAKGENF